MRRLCLLALPLLTCTWPALAQAGTYADALSQCLIRSTTPADQKTVVRWAFATMALDPDVASMATIPPAQRATINQQAGTLVTDLLAESCSRPAQQALMFEGPDAVEAGEHFIAELPDYEFDIPRQLVADAAIVEVDHALAPEPRLAVSVELLLLEDA